ncbi:cupin domain-containing protein [Pedobacter sp.]|uniref:cupin domain-containing protein n=1 Tax=Pedobacter sp. TaxID=1411316 RepID=UPI003D7F2E87
MKVSIVAICMLGALAGCKSAAEESSIFPKGEKSPNVNHTGNVWLKELNHADSVFTYSTSVAISDPEARLNWHVHPGGQILIVTEGVGYYQERNKPKRTIKKGDVIKCLPGVEHWHGATPDQGVTYIATSPAEKGKTIWMEKVSDEDYYGKK